MKIWPMGDSITWGKNRTPGGYRWILYQKLVAAGFTVNYLGTSNENPATGQTEVWHDGWPGLRIDELDARTPNALDQIGDPDVVLILLGANDFLQNYYEDDAISRMDALLWKIFTLRPTCTIIVGSITQQGSIYASNTPLIASKYNAYLPGIIANHVAMGQKVYMCDLYNAVSVSNLEDGVHPTDTGYQQMGTAWYNTIMSTVALETPTQASTRPPAVWHVTVQPDLSGVVISFTKPVSDSAAVASNYTPGSGMFTVTGAALDSTGTNPNYNVTLNTGSLAPNTVYTVTLNNITDRTANAIPMAANTVVTFRTPGANWDPGATGNWSTVANWDTGVVPNSAGASALLTSSTLATRTVTLDSNITLGQLSFGTNTSGTQTLANSTGKSLIFDNQGNGAILTKLHTNTDIISAPIILKDDLNLAGGAYTLSGNISESGSSWSIIASADATISGSNSYSGGTYVLGNTIQPKNNNAFGTGPIIVSRGGELSLPAAITIPNPISVGGSGLDGGSLYLWAASNATRTFSGPLSLTANATFSAANTVGMALKLSGSVNLNNYTMTLLRVSGSAVQNWSIDGPISGSGGITFNFASAVGSSLTLSGSNSFTGTTKLSGSATLKINNTNALRSSTLDTSTASGGKGVTFSVSGTNTYNIGGLMGSDDIALGVNAISVGASNGSTTFAGVLSGSGASALTKVGTGTLTLTGSHSYSGSTKVSAGTLAVANGGSIGATSLLTVQSGAIFSGTGPLGGNLVNNGSITTGTAMGMLTVPGNFTQTSGNLTLKLGGTDSPGGSYDQLAVAGTANLGGVLNVSLNSGYVPSAGSSFVLLQGGKLSGTFSSVNLPTLSNGLKWGLSYGANAVSLVADTGFNLFASQIPDSSQRSFQADPDGDGFCNLIEYAIGGNPSANDTPSKIKADSSTGVLSLVFTRNTSSDATIIVEGSSDLSTPSNWTPIATFSGGSWGGATNVTESGSGSIVTVTVKDTASGASKRFLRLRVVGQ